MGRHPRCSWVTLRQVLNESVHSWGRVIRIVPPIKWTSLSIARACRGLWEPQHFANSASAQISLHKQQCSFPQTNISHLFIFYFTRHEVRPLPTNREVRGLIPDPHLANSSKQCASSHILFLFGFDGVVIAAQCTATF